MSGYGGKERKPVSRRAARIITGVTVVLFVLAGAGAWKAVAKFSAIDACLDGGGAWHVESERCAADLETWQAYEAEAAL